MNLNHRAILCLKKVARFNVCQPTGANGLPVTATQTEDASHARCVTLALMFSYIVNADSLTLLVGISIAFGFPLGVALPISLSVIQGSAPNGRENEAIGLSYSITTGLQTLAPMVLVWSTSQLGVAAVAYGIAGVLLAASALVFTATRIYHMESDSEEQL